jgi:hypothetical protein
MTRERATFVEGVLWFIAGLAVMAFLARHAIGQTNTGPMRTPQINQNLYVGQSGYATIQSAVTFACKQTNPSYAVVIQPGIHPSDTPAAATGGCTGTYIADLRIMPMTYYGWNGTAYVVSSQMGQWFTATASSPGPPIPGSVTLESPGSVDEGLITAFGKTSTQVAGMELTGGNSTGTIFKHYLLCKPLTPTTYQCTIDSTTTNFTGEIDAPRGNIAGSPICTVANPCSSGGGTYPPAGVGVSTGTSWDTSIDATTLARTATGNNFYGNNFFNGSWTAFNQEVDIAGPTVMGVQSSPNATVVQRDGSLSAPSITVAGSPVCTEATGCETGPGPTYPPAGIGVSTGTSWNATSIDPTTVPRTNVANTYSSTALQTFNGGVHIISPEAGANFVVYPPAPNVGGITGWGLLAQGSNAPPPAGHLIIAPTDSPNGTICLFDCTIFQLDQSGLILNSRAIVSTQSVPSGNAYGHLVQVPNLAVGSLILSGLSVDGNINNGAFTGFGFAGSGSAANFGYLQVAGGVQVRYDNLAHLYSANTPFCLADGFGCPAGLAATLPILSKPAAIKAVTHCRKGAMWIDGDYLMVCMAKNTVKRAKLEAFSVESASR